ncbi:MAG TPA: DUF5818 domain-containing protein [Candidatus Acidoferrales bacterium]|nr:DUF5818 domain-containing protein [Candidatus Acidoferrales bacterium]
MKKRGVKMHYWKDLALCLIAVIFLSFTGPSVMGGDEKVFTGAIGDTQCAMNVHSLDKSHKEMLKVSGVGKTAADCTLYCIKNRGGRFVLQNKNNVYRLDKPELVEPYAGQKVQITGILDPQAETIEVHKIDPVR